MDSRWIKDRFEHTDPPSGGSGTTPPAGGGGAAAPSGSGGGTAAAATVTSSAAVPSGGSPVLVATPVPPVRIRAADGTSDPDRCVPINKEIELRAIPNSGITGTCQWSKTSGKITLANETTDRVTVRAGSVVTEPPAPASGGGAVAPAGGGATAAPTSGGGTGAPAAGPPPIGEEITLVFTPSGLAPVTLTTRVMVINVVFSAAAAQRYGFDDMGPTAEETAAAPTTGGGGTGAAPTTGGGGTGAAPATGGGGTGAAPTSGGGGSGAAPTTGGGGTGAPASGGTSASTPPEPHLSVKMNDNTTVRVTIEGGATGDHIFWTTDDATKADITNGGGGATGAAPASGTGGTSSGTAAPATSSGGGAAPATTSSGGAAPATTSGGGAAASSGGGTAPAASGGPAPSPTAGRGPAFDLTVYGKNKEKETAIISAHANGTSGPVAATLNVDVFREKETTATVLLVYDSASSGTTLTRASLDLAATVTTINGWYKSCVGTMALTPAAVTGSTTTPASGTGTGAAPTTGGGGTGAAPTTGGGGTGAAPATGGGGTGAAPTSGGGGSGAAPTTGGGGAAAPASGGTTATAVDLRYDTNNNGTLDLEPAGTSPEARVVNNALSGVSGQKIIVVKDLAWIFYLRRAASAGDTVIKLKHAYSRYMQYVGVNAGYTVGAGATAEPIEVDHKSGEDVHLKTALINDHPTTDGLIFPLLGLSGNPIYVAEAALSLAKEVETIGHEMGHSKMNWLDLTSIENMMNADGSNTDNQIRCRELPKSYESGTEKQWDLVRRRP